MNSAPTGRVSVELLESRRLLAWGASAQLIHQDAAAMQFPTITGKGVTVAILDTGVDYTHPALGGGFGPGFKVKAGFDLVDNDPDPLDTFGHGTNNAGLIAAKPFMLNGQQYSGVAPDAELVALRIARGGEVVPDAIIEKALQWIETNYATYDISIVNFSFGGGRYVADQINPILSDDFKKLADLGILVVSPSGNDGATGGPGINYPAADPNVVAVGSVSLADSISTFTQRGPTLDLLAPGESVATTSIGGNFGLISATSYSPPIVAGAAALLKQIDPSLRAKDMLSNLRASGVRKDDTTGGSLQIYPRIDLVNAITVALRRAPNLKSDVGRAGVGNDLAFDKQGVLHFAYYDTVLHTIKYATRSTSGAWSATRIIDTTGHDVGATLSLAVDPLGRPSLAYYDATDGDLAYARFDGLSWRRSTLDSKRTVGQFASLAFDSSGNPAIAYYRKTTGDLRVMRVEGGVFTRSDVDADGDVGLFASLAISASGIISVAYANKTTGDLKYAQLSGQAWNVETVDDLNGVAFISLAFDRVNRPAISYYDVFPADLKYATRASGAWQSETIDARGAVGLFSNLWFGQANAGNIVYYNRKRHRLIHLNGAFGNWTAELLVQDFGEDAVASPTFDGAAAAYSWQDSFHGKLVVGDVT